jgi:predicted nucleic acid-binding Zn ribbon protein
MKTLKNTTLKNMQQLKKVLKKAISESGFKKALDQEDAVFIWGEVVGKNISKVTEATGVDKGTLVIKTESATWRQELHMQKKEIINKINKKIGSIAIKEIRFI